jgi:tRNA pseudouridine38-40 synthase
MPRYFLSVRYMGTRYAGSQVQENAMTIQGELEKAMAILFREKVPLTGSSRTDAGVHAAKNFFHFDWEREIEGDPVYQLNAILPADIAVLEMALVSPGAHCRFDALAREYEYRVYNSKDPFTADRGWFYPYPLDLDLLNLAAVTILGTHDFTSFAKRNTQVHTHQCTIMKSEWSLDQGGYTYKVKGNRFLRGMVRGLVATMTRVGRGRITVEEFGQILVSGDCTQADFSAPAQGLLLSDVLYKEGLFLDAEKL